MKILLVTLSPLSFGQLLTDEPLENIHFLMQAGCYGRLEMHSLGDRTPALTIRETIARCGGRCVLIDDQADIGQDVFGTAAEIATTSGWDYLQLAVRAERTGSSSATAQGAALPHLDRRIGALLEQFDEETAVVLLTGDDATSDSGFILAAPSGLVQGAVDGVQPDELIGALLALAGLQPAEAAPNRLLLPAAPSAVAGGALTSAEMALLRERLSGLGYIG